MARLFLFVGFMSAGLWLASLLFVTPPPPITKAPTPQPAKAPPQHFSHVKLKAHNNNALLWYVSAQQAVISDKGTLLRQATFRVYPKTASEAANITKRSPGLPAGVASAANPVPLFYGSCAQLSLKDDTWLLKGRVRIVDHLGRRIEANQLQYQQSQSLLTGQGDVLITDGRVVQTASSFTYHLNTGEMILLNPTIYVTPDQKKPDTH